MRVITRTILVLAVFSAVVVAFRPSPARAACLPGTATHFVRGNGSVTTGTFKLEAQENSATESGTVSYTQFATASATTIYGNLNCVDFSGSRVDFSGFGRVWNGIFWEPGYTITGFAVDGGPTPPLDQFSLAWCKNSVCFSFANPVLTSGFVTIRNP